MADKTERPNPYTVLNTLADRVMARWQQTPMTATVQRAIRPTAIAPATPLARAHATQGFVQRVEAKSELAVWKPRATTKQVAIENFTDGLVQRFPDISAKYMARPAEEGSSGSPGMIYSGSGATTSGADNTSEAGSHQKPSSEDTFDVNQLPSIPADIVARHKEALQKRAESLNPPASPRAMQRKAADGPPSLVRPRSKVDYIGSKSNLSASGTPEVSAPTPATPAAPAQPTDTMPLQAKAEESAIQETTPLEEPKWRTRPRAGFQSIPSQATSDSGRSNSVPFAPIQAQKEEGSSELSESAPAEPIQRETGNDGEDDTTPPDGGTPPPSPPSSLPPSSPLQLASAPEAASTSVDMPLRAAPPAAPATALEDATVPTESHIDLPSLTQGVPAKAVRRTSQAAPILRKPILPVAARPVGEGSTASPSAASTPPMPVQSLPSTPLQRVEASEEISTLEKPQALGQAMVGSLHENVATPLSIDSAASVPSESSVIQPKVDRESPLQRHEATEDAEPISVAPNPSVNPLLEPNEMPLRQMESGTTPVQRQTDPATDVEPFVRAEALPSATASAALQRQIGEMVDTSTGAKSSAATASEESATLGKNPSIQRVVESTPSTHSEAAPSINESQVEDRATAPVQRRIEAPTPSQPTASPVESAVATPVPSSPEVLSREEMPLRQGDLPVQRQTVETETAEPVPNLIEARSETSNSATPVVQRVTSEEPSAEINTPSISEPRSISSKTADNLANSAPAIQQVTAPINTNTPVQRVSAAPTPSEMPDQAEMPLRQQGSSSEPVQRETAAPTASGIPNQADIPLRQEVATSQPVQREAATTSEQRAHPSTDSVTRMTNEAISMGDASTDQSPVVQRYEAQSNVSTVNDAGDSTLAETKPTTSPQVDSVATDTPMQRVAAEIEAAPPTIPTQSDMPLRQEVSLPSPVTPVPIEESLTPTPTRAESISDDVESPVQRMVEPAENTPSVSEVSPKAEAPAARESTDFPTLQGEAPLQRVVGEVSKPESVIATHVEMPLRHEAPSSPALQRQVTESGDSESITPLAEASSADSAPLQRQPVAEAQQKVDALPVAANPTAIDSDDSPSSTVVAEDATSQPNRSASRDSAPEQPVQRFAAEFDAPSPSLPTMEEMPLRTLGQDNPPVQRVEANDEATESVAAPIETPSVTQRMVQDSQTTSVVSESITRDNPVQRVAIEPASPHTEPVEMTLRAPSTEKGEGETSSVNTEPLVQRMADQNTVLHAESEEVSSQTTRVEEVAPQASSVISTSSTPDVAVQRVTIESAAPHTESAEMPLRVTSTEGNSPQPQNAEVESVTSDLPVQRITSERTTSVESVEMPLRVPPTATENPQTPPTVATPSESEAPVQRATIESAPLQDEPMKMPLRVTQRDATETTQTSSAVVEPISTSEVPVQRVEIESNATQPVSVVMPLQVDSTEVTETPSQIAMEPLTSDVPVQRVALESTTPAESLEMPLRVPPTDSALSVQRMAGKTPITAEESQPTPFTNKVGFNETTSPTIAESRVESASPSASDSPVQRVALESESVANTPLTSADMPLRVQEGSPSEPQPSAISNESMGQSTPVQRVSAEQATNSSTAVNLPKPAGVSTETTPTPSAPIQRVTATTPQASSATVPQNTPQNDPVQRVEATPTLAEMALPERADMPLRESTPTTSPATMVQASEMEEIAPSDISIGYENASPTSSPEQSHTAVSQPVPVQRVVATPTSQPTVNAPIQTKARVKATKIQRTTQPMVQREALPIVLPHTPLQRMESTDKFTNPTLSTLPLAEPAMANAEVGTTPIVAAPIQRMTAGQQMDLPLQRQPDPIALAPSITTPTSSTNNFAAIPSPRPPMGAAEPAIQRISSASESLPLVQRAQTTTQAQPSEDYMDLRALLDDEEDASGTTSTENSTKAPGSVEKREPSESDALKALHTLADQIYPLLIQMIARERERHSGF